MLKKVQAVTIKPDSPAAKLEDWLKSDFRFFLTLLWNEMHLPKPTKMQLLFADALQKSDDRKLAMLGYRGFAKTYITCAFAMWLLYKDPNLQIAIWAANQENAVDSTQLMLNWVKQVSWLRHLHPTESQNQSKTSFDVKGRGQFRGSSVKAYGITGTVTGTRGDFLLIDDPETSSNGDTVKRRMQIDRAINEASLVVKAKSDDVMTRIVVLGTVHFDDSLYVRLLGQGYKMYLFPMAVPSLDTQKLCWPYYLEPLRKLMRPISDGGLGLIEGTPLDRFGADEIELRKGIGLLNYERQCLVNPFKTSLSEKPFDLTKAIIFEADSDRLPIRFNCQRDERFIDEDLMGFSSASLLDKLYRPYSWDDQTQPYDRKIMRIDPAGDKINRTADETAFGVAGAAGGYAVLFWIEGMVGGSREENLRRILEVAYRFKVDVIRVEDNGRGELYAATLRAFQMREYGRFAQRREDIIPIETVNSSANKHRRIVASIDPVLNSGKLVITPECIRNDYTSAEVHQTEDKMCFRLTYQLSNANEIGNKLEHDDRVDIVAALLEDLAPCLQVHPADSAETWDDRLIREAFAADEVQFLPGQGLVDAWATTQREFRGTRSGFLK